MPRTESGRGRHKPSPRALAILGVAAVVVYGLDRITKVLVVDRLSNGVPFSLIGDVVQLRFVENPGAAFSLGSGSTWVFALIAAAVAVFIVLFARRIRSVWWALLFGLLLGGTLGNLTDRLIRPPGFGVGHVVDFVVVKYFPGIFNLADVAIVVAMGVFILLTLRGVRLDGLKARKPAPASSAPAGADETASPSIPTK